MRIRMELTPKMYTVHVIIRDSLGNKVSEYDSKMHGEDYRRLMCDAEEVDGLMVAFKDCQVDDELGYREIYLT